LKVLVVEHDPQLSLLLQEFFEGRGHQVFSCRDQIQALPYLVEHSIDLALLDYHQEQGTTQLLVGKLALDFPRVTILLMAENQEEVALTTIRKMGVRHILIKPFRLRELADGVKDIEKMCGIREAPEDPVNLTLYTSVDVEELNSFQSVLRANPKDQHARWLLAFSYYRARKFANAHTLLSQIVSEGQDNLLARYYLGACDYQLGDPQGALEQWKVVVRHDAIGPLAAKLRIRIGAIEKVLAESSVPPPRQEN
jgi:CheY-like chemotaxis protein